MNPGSWKKKRALVTGHSGSKGSLSPRETLDWTVYSYKRFYSGENARAITLDQIHAYQKLASAKVRAIG